MDYEVHVVHQDPFGLTAAFDGVGIGGEVALEAQLDLVGDGEVLALVGAVGDEEVVGETAFSGVEGEDADVFGLLVFGGCCGGEQKLRLSVMNLLERLMVMGTPQRVYSDGSVGRSGLLLLAAR